MYQQGSHEQEALNGRLTAGLGLFSLALGAAEILAPGRLAETIGVRPDPGTLRLLRAYGAREVVSGLAILMQPHAAGPVWSRVAGDGLDMSTLLAWMRDERNDRGRLCFAAMAVSGAAALDWYCAQQLEGRTARGRSEGAVGHERHRIHVERVTTLNKGMDEVYAFWRDFSNFPRFMRHLESVEVIDQRRSRWRAKAPAGMTVEWEAEITEDRAPDVIAWRSLPGSQVQHAGSVRFARAPGERGTEVRVSLDYAPPAGALGRTIAWLFREDPDQQIHEDLHRFKQLAETGEIPISDGPLLWRAAQPAADTEELRRTAGVRS